MMQYTFSIIHPNRSRADEGIDNIFWGDREARFEIVNFNSTYLILNQGL